MCLAWSMCWPWLKAQINARMRFSHLHYSALVWRMRMAWNRILADRNFLHPLIFSTSCRFHKMGRWWGTWLILREMSCQQSAQLRNQMMACSSAILEGIVCHSWRSRTTVLFSLPEHLPFIIGERFLFLIAKVDTLATLKFAQTMHTKACFTWDWRMNTFSCKMECLYSRSMTSWLYLVDSDEACFIRIILHCFHWGGLPRYYILEFKEYMLSWWRFEDDCNLLDNIQLFKASLCSLALVKLLMPYKFQSLLDSRKKYHKLSTGKQIFYGWESPYAQGTSQHLSLLWMTNWCLHLPLWKITSCSLRVSFKGSWYQTPGDVAFESPHNRQGSLSVSRTEG